MLPLLTSQETHLETFLDTAVDYIYIGPNNVGYRV